MKPTIRQIIGYYGFTVPEFYYSKLQCCPFPDHKDSTPSFKYYEKTESYYCWGCSRGGDSFSFAYDYFSALGEEKSVADIIKDFTDEDFLEEIQIQDLVSRIESIEAVEPDLDLNYFRISNMLNDYVQRTKNYQFADKFYQLADEYYNSERLDDLRQLTNKIPKLLTSKSIELPESIEHDLKPGTIDFKEYYFIDAEKKRMIEYLKTDFLSQYIQYGKPEQFVLKLIDKLSRLIKQNETYKQQTQNSDWDKKFVIVETYWGPDSSIDYEMLVQLRTKNVPLLPLQFELIEKRFQIIENKLHSKFDLLVSKSQQTQSLKPNLRFFNKT